MQNMEGLILKVQASFPSDRYSSLFTVGDLRPWTFQPNINMSLLYLGDMPS